MSASAIGRPATGLGDGLHLFALAGFAFAQPLFDLLSHYPAFFTSHRSAPSHIVCFALAAVALPPMVPVASVRLAGRVSARASQILQSFWVCALLSLIALPFISHSDVPGAIVDPDSNTLAFVQLGVALAVGGLGTLVYRRSQWVRNTASVLALAPVAFLIAFSLKPDIGRLLSVGGTGEVLYHSVGATAPVVIVVFDELPTVSLLDAEGHIDARRAPHFAALARDATWYRNATGVHTSTIHAVPAILTGNEPIHHLFPTRFDHPQNLFSLLESEYDMHVVESETMLYRDNDPDSPTAGPWWARFQSMGEDASLVYLHRVLPAAWARSLPAVTNTWKNFAERPREFEFATRAKRKIWVGYEDPQTRFETFIENIGPCENRCLHFIHTTLPHQPWQLLPSGRRYTPHTTFGAKEPEDWIDEPQVVAEGYQQHLLQLGAADRLLGLLIARLRETNLYDRALVAVVADHGVSFWPGESMRRFSGSSHEADLIRVPMFIKAPHQTDAVTSDALVQTTDFLPTLAAALGMDLPWTVDGCDVASPDCASREAIVAFDQTSQPHTFDASLFESRESLDHKFDLLDEAADNGQEWTYRLRPFGSSEPAVGSRLDTRAEDSESRYRGHLTPLAIERAQRTPTTDSLSRITGRLQPIDAGPIDASVPVELAIAVDGIVEARVLAMAQTLRSYRFSAFVPEDRVGPGTHEISVHVRNDPDRARGSDANATWPAAIRRQVVVPAGDSALRSREPAALTTEASSTAPTHSAHGERP